VKTSVALRVLEKLFESTRAHKNQKNNFILSVTLRGNSEKVIVVQKNCSNYKHLQASD